MDEDCVSRLCKILSKGFVSQVYSSRDWRMIFLLVLEGQVTAEGTLRGNRLLKLQWFENGNTSLGKFEASSIKTPKQSY